MQHILNKILIVFLSLMAFSTFLNGKQKWESFTFGIPEDFTIRMQTSPITLTKERAFKWDGDTTPFFTLCVGRRPSLEIYYGRLSEETYKYASDLIRNAAYRKIGLKKALEHNDPDKGVIFWREQSYGFSTHDKEGYISKEKAMIAMEMLLNDLEPYNENQNCKAGISESKVFLSSKLDLYSKNISRATLGYGALKMKIFEDFICLQKVKEDSTISAVLQKDGDFKDLICYLKANSLSDADSAHRDEKSVDIKVESQNSVWEYAFETPYVWEYAMSLISNPGDAAAVDNASVPKNIMPSRALNVPPEFKGKIETPGQAEKIALTAFARRYRDPFNPVSAKPIKRPVKFSHRILKLDDTMRRFGASGAKVWQVEMFDENGGLSCVAWINPENDEALLKSSGNIAKDVNAETVKFILEPVQVRRALLPRGKNYRFL